MISYIDTRPSAGIFENNRLNAVKRKNGKTLERKIIYLGNLLKTELNRRQRMVVINPTNYDNNTDDVKTATAAATAAATIVFKPTEKQTLFLKVLDKGHNVFLTGPGGCGKTALINHFLDPNRVRDIEDAQIELKLYPKRFAAFTIPDNGESKQTRSEMDANLLSGLLKPASGTWFSPTVTCPTGVGATQILHGNTIHSTFKLNHGDCSFSTIRDSHHDFLSNSPIKKKCVGFLYGRIVLEEASMIGGKLFEGLDAYSRVVKNVADEAFGGAQVIASGDFMQLPPINQEFCFKSPSWDACGFLVLLMTESVRQRGDIYFSSFLRKLRMGNAKFEDFKPYTDPKRLVEIKCRMAEANNMIATVGVVDENNVMQDVEDIGSLTSELIHARVKEANILLEGFRKPIFITGTNKVCDKLNKEELITKIGALPNWERERHFHRAITVNLHRFKEIVEDACTTIPKEGVVLCFGCEVRFTAPIYTEGIVNGTRGRVLGINPPDILDPFDYSILVYVYGKRLNGLKRVVKVEIRKKEVLVNCNELTKDEKYELELPLEAKKDGDKNSPWRVVGSCKYMALKMFYTTTIHAAQGLTITDPLIVNVGDFGCNKPAYVYVAMSRLEVGSNLFIINSAEQTNNFLLGKKKNNKNFLLGKMNNKTKRNAKTAMGDDWEGEEEQPPPAITRDTLMSKVGANQDCLSFYKQLERRTDDETVVPFRFEVESDEGEYDTLHKVWAVLEFAIKNGLYERETEAMGEEVSSSSSSSSLQPLCIFDLWNLSVKVLVGIEKSDEVSVSSFSSIVSPAAILGNISTLSPIKVEQYENFIFLFHKYLKATSMDGKGLMERVEWVWKDTTNKRRLGGHRIGGGGTVEILKYVPGVFHQSNRNNITPQNDTAVKKETFVSFFSERIKEIAADRKLVLTNKREEMRKICEEKTTIQLPRIDEEREEEEEENFANDNERYNDLEEEDEFMTNLYL